MKLILTPSRRSGVDASVHRDSLAEIGAPLIRRTACDGGLLDLELVSGARAVRNAVGLLREQLTATATCKMRQTVGFHGGSVTETVHWSSQLGVWSLFKNLENRYWNCFGVQRPDVGRSLQITVEVNSPLEGLDRKMGGAVARETSSGKLYLVHRGRIGGGQKGIGAELFWNRFRGGVQMREPGREDASRVMVVGEIGGGSLPRDVAAFVREVGRIKRAAASWAGCPVRVSANQALLRRRFITCSSDALNEARRFSTGKAQQILNIIDTRPPKSDPATLAQHGNEAYGPGSWSRLRSATSSSRQRSERVVPEHTRGCVTQQAGSSEDFCSATTTINGDHTIMRTKQTNGGGSGTAKVNLIILQMEGETSMLAKSIDSFVHAMTVKPNGVQARVSGGSSPAGALQSPTSEVLDDIDDGTLTAEPSSLEDTNPAPARHRSPPRKLKLVAGLNIAEGDTPFSAFCEGKDPKDWAAKIVLAGTWMRDHRQRAEFNADDVYTCLRHQWTAAPDDLPQMLRDMTRRELLEKGTARGAFTLSMMSEKKLKKIENGA